MRRVLVTLVVAVGLLFAGQGAAAAAPAGDGPGVGDTTETVVVQPTAHTPPPGTCFANCKQYPPYEIGDGPGESVLTPFTNDEPARGPGGGGDDDEDRSCTAPCPV